MSDNKKTVCPVEGKKVLNQLNKKSTLSQEQISPEIQDILEHSGVAVRYALITQLLGKSMNSRIDILALQKGDGKGWDARSLAHKAVVPFEQSNFPGALGASKEPYLSKPLRTPRITVEQKRSPAQWQQLIEVLERATSSAKAEKLLQEVLSELRHKSRVHDGHRKKLVSIRGMVSAAKLRLGISRFLAKKTGGRRLQTVVTAVYKTLATTKVEVLYGDVNAADSIKGTAGDITLKSCNNYSTVVEVRDRKITLADVHDTIGKARDAGVEEIIIIANSKTLFDRKEAAAVRKLCREWEESGRSITIQSFQDLWQGFLSSSTAESRRRFLTHMAEIIRPSDLGEWCKLFQESLGEV